MIALPSPSTATRARRGLLAALVAALAAAPVHAQDGTAGEGAAPDAGAAQETPAALPLDTVVAVVAGREITEGDLSLVPPSPETAQMSIEQRRAAALAQLIDLSAVAAKAEAEGVADAEFDRVMRFLRDRQLAATFVRRSVRPAVTEELLRQRYEEEIGAIPPSEEIRASHILLETEEEALKAIEELDAGADFAELARARSTGPSAPRGGDLGYFGPGRMVPEFDAAARALEVGAYSKEPVQTQFGFHVIKVADKRNLEPPAFEQVQDQLRELVEQELEFEAVRAARGEAAIEVRDPQLATLLAPLTDEATEEETPAAADGEADAAADGGMDAAADGEAPVTDGATSREGTTQ